MSLASNLSLASFFDTLKIEDVSFTPNYHQELSRAGAELLAADLAPMSYMAELSTVPLAHSEANKVIALLNSRHGALQTLLLCDSAGLYPAADITGAGWGSATPVVGTITNRYVCAFTGFPNNYVITAGDYLQIIYDTSRYYLGQFAESKVASGGGAVTAVELSVALPDLIVGGEAVTMIKPAGKFRITLNSAKKAITYPMQSVVSFTAEQTSAK